MLKIISYYFLLSVCPIFGMESSGSNQDPVAGINYSKAFDQSDFYKQFEDLLQQLGCLENAYQDGYLDTKQCYAHEKINIDEIDWTLAEIDFKEKCLGRLNQARRAAILRPLYDSGTCLGLLLSTGGLASIWLPGSEPLFVSISAINMVFFTKNIITSLSNWYDTKSHPVDKFEKIYAENKCYIPHEIWHCIEDEFLKARSNQYSQNQSLSFLEFALGLTVHKKKRALANFDMEQISNKLSKKIDKFFKDYEEHADAKELFALKASIDNFVLGLLGGKERSRYIYLSGSKGLGKTHFARKLNGWITKLMPQSTAYSEQAVRSPAQLGGSLETPGFLLSALRMQCAANTNGSVILLDDAAWINNSSYLSDALNVFENPLLPLRAKYFGDGINGNGIELKMPPILIILAGIADIKDDTLKSYFDFFTFPKPKKEALFKHALKEIKKHPSANSINGLFVEHDRKKIVLAKKFEENLHKEIGDIDNFHDIATLIHSLVKKWAEEIREGKSL